MKILHLPTSVGGNAWGLAQAEKELGLESEVLVAKQNWLNYDADINLNLENKNFFSQSLILYKTFQNIKNKYDVFHFNYGSSLLDFQKLGFLLLDLPYYNKSKKIIFTYNGSDARAVHPLDYWDDLPAPRNILYRKLVRKIKKKKIQKVNKYADHIFALNPDLLRYLPPRATFLPYSISNWETIERRKYQINNTIKIIHSPTSREFKGSTYILNALDELQKRYSNIEVKIVENISNKEALKLYKEAHLVIDQVLIGWYGGFAVEVMKMGIPVAVYINEDDLKYIPSQMADDLKKSIINITPFNIVEVLSAFIENKQLLYDKSIQVSSYVETWHDPLYVAGLTKKIYES